MYFMSSGNHSRRRTRQQRADDTVLLEQSVQQTAAHEAPACGEAVPVVHRDGLLLDEGPQWGVARLNGWAWAWAWTWAWTWATWTTWTWAWAWGMGMGMGMSMGMGMGMGMGIGVDVNMATASWVHAVQLLRLYCGASRTSSHGVRYCAMLYSLWLHEP
jgi:hypothetical protein